MKSEENYLSRSFVCGNKIFLMSSTYSLVYLGHNDFFDTVYRFFPSEVTYRKKYLSENIHSFQVEIH